MDVVKVIDELECETVTGGAEMRDKIPVQFRCQIPTRAYWSLKLQCKCYRFKRERFSIEVLKLRGERFLQ